MQREEINYISVPESYYMDPKHWAYYKDAFSYSGHVHYRSPYECADDCGTCDGANCERCREIYEEPTIVFSYEPAQEIVKAFGLDDEETIDNLDAAIADDFGDGSFRASDGKLYKIAWPDWYDLSNEERAKLGEALEVDESFL